MAYTVIGSPISPYVRKVMLALNEKGVSYAHEDANPFAPPEGFREISPLGRIPAFRHDDRVINDSSIICRYVDRLEPKVPLYPDEPYLSARAEWIEEYVDGGMVPIVGPKLFLPRVLGPLLGRPPADENEIRKVVDEELPTYFDYLERQLGDNGHFVGNALTIADVTVAASFGNIRLAGVNPDKKRQPKLHAFIKRMHGRETFKRIMDPVMGLVGKLWKELD
jgi:glutathione S-transferase